MLCCFIVRLNFSYLLFGFLLRRSIVLKPHLLDGHRILYIHMGSHPMSFFLNCSCFHMRIDYIITYIGVLHFHSLECTPFGIVVERSPVQSFAANCPLPSCVIEAQIRGHLGFNHMPSHSFFLLSSPSRLKLFVFTLWLNEL